MRRITEGFFICLSALALVVGTVLANDGPRFAQQPDATPRPLYALPNASATGVVTSNTLALSSSLGLLVTTNLLGDSISIVAPNAGELRAQIPVADDPRTVAMTPDGLRALVVSRSSSVLTVFDLTGGEPAREIDLDGTWAYGVVALSNDIAIVSFQGDNAVALVSLVDGSVLERITTPSFPTGLALWG
ncbi:MAG: hypothetical protein AAF125_12130, partial [Chloroflexota bacterium]